MRFWNVCLTAVVLCLAGISFLQQFQIKRLEAEQARASSDFNGAAKSFLEAATTYKEEREDGARFRALLLKHNKLLIHNVNNGNLEPARSPKDE